MKPMSYFFVVALALAGCKKTATTVVDLPGNRVTGRLAYLQSCRGGAFLPFPGVSFSGGPTLYLTDGRGAVRGGYAKPGADGVFTLPGIAAGTYDLRLAAGALVTFYNGTPTQKIRVVVEGEGAKVDVGTVCANVNRPELQAVVATWGDGSRSVASNGQTLHLEAAAGAATLSVEAARDGAPVMLTTALSIGAAEAQAGFSVAGTTLHWPAEATSATVKIVAGDGWGSFLFQDVAVRLRAGRSDGIRVGGMLDLADPATREAFRITTDAVAAAFVTDGVRVWGSGFPVERAAFRLRAQYLPVTTATAASMRIDTLDPGTAVVLTLQTTRGMLGAARLRAAGDGGVFELLGAAGQVFGSVAYPAHGEVLIYLAYDPSVGVMTGGIGTNGIEAWLEGDVGLATRRLQPQLLVMQDGGVDPLALDLTVHGLWVSAQTTVYALPLAPGVRGEAVFDRLDCSLDVSGAFAFVDGGVYFGGGLTDLSIDAPAAISRSTFYRNGCPTTAYHDAGLPSDETVTEVVTEPDAMVPINGGASFLY